MVSQVRSDEGLAYSVYSDYEIGDLYPGTFRAGFQSKSSTCARAAQVTVQLIGKITTTEATDKELASSKNSFIEKFPRLFESKLKTVTRYAQDDLLGLPHEYWKTYRTRMAEVTAASAQAAAKAHIKPDRLIVLVVGNVDDILKGHPDHPDARFESLGPLVRLPLLDPLTLKPMT
jgi:zinc protease